MLNKSIFLISEFQNSLWQLSVFSILCVSFHLKVYGNYYIHELSRFFVRYITAILRPFSCLVQRQRITTWKKRGRRMMFDWSSHLRAMFAGERRFSKSRGLSASVSFFPSPTPSSLFRLATQFRAGKMPFLGLSLIPNPRPCLVRYVIGN